MGHSTTMQIYSLTLAHSIGLCHIFSAHIVLVGSSTISRWHHQLYLAFCHYHHLKICFSGESIWTNVLILLAHWGHHIYLSSNQALSDMLLSSLSLLCYQTVAPAISTDTALMTQPIMFGLVFSQIHMRNHIDHTSWSQCQSKVLIIRHSWLSLAHRLNPAMAFSPINHLFHVFSTRPSYCNRHLQLHDCYCHAITSVCLWAIWPRRLFSSHSLQYYPEKRVSNTRRTHIYAIELERFNHFSSEYNRIRCHGQRYHRSSFQSQWSSIRLTRSVSKSISTRPLSPFE